MTLRAVPPYVPSPDAQPVRIGGSEARDSRVAAGVLRVVVILLALALGLRNWT